MEINIFAKYKVTRKCKYSFINEYGDFSDGEGEWTKELDCYDFLKLIIDLINDNEFIALRISDNIIYFEMYNSNGETNDIWITYEEMDGEE